jgi:hypothetical protein
MRIKIFKQLNAVVRTLFIVSDLLWRPATLVLCSLAHSLTAALLTGQSQCVTSHAME